MQNRGCSGRSGKVGQQEDSPKVGGLKSLPGLAQMCGAIMDRDW